MNCCFEGFFKVVLQIHINYVLKKHTTCKWSHRNHTLFFVHNLSFRNSYLSYCVDNQYLYLPSHTTFDILKPIFYLLLSFISFQDMFSGFHIIVFSNLRLLIVWNISWRCLHWLYYMLSQWFSANTDFISRWWTCVDVGSLVDVLNICTVFIFRVKNMGTGRIPKTLLIQVTSISICFLIFLPHIWGSCRCY